MEHGQRFVLHLSKRNKYADHPKQKERQEPIGRATLRNYVRAIRGFASYLDAEGLTKENVFKRLKSPKDDKRVVEVLSDEEIQALYDNINPSTAIGSRLFVIITLLLDTGIRIGELKGIALDDIDFRHSKVKVQEREAKSGSFHLALPPPRRSSTTPITIALNLGATNCYLTWRGTYDGPVPHADN